MKYYSALNYSLKILEKRPKSVGELKKKLIEKKFPKEEINLVIEKLIDNKFLDDEVYARNFIRQKIEFRHEGKRRIAQELRQKLISEEIITRQLAIIKEESETAKEAAEKWLKIKGKSEKAREKLFRHLISKGFSYDIIKPIIDQI